MSDTQPELIPLSNDDSVAIARTELTIILAAHLLNLGYPLHNNNGTGTIPTIHNGHRFTITVKATK